MYGKFLAPQNLNLDMGGIPKRKTRRLRGPKMAAPVLLYSAKRLMTCTEEYATYTQSHNIKQKEEETYVD